MEYTEDGKKFCRGEGKRKWAYAWVKVFADGTGKFTVNGHSYLPEFLKEVQEREVVAAPLVLTGLLGKVDVEAEVCLEAQFALSYAKVKVPLNLLEIPRCSVTKRDPSS